MKTAIIFTALAVASVFILQAGSAPSESGVKLPPEAIVCDSEGFLKAAQEAERSRVSKRIDEVTFAKMCQEPNTIVLDARSNEHWKQLRVKGSVNLPYTEFSAKALERLVPTRETRILIYCRNNLVDTRPQGAFPVEPQQPTRFLTNTDSVPHPYPDDFNPPQIPKAFQAGLNIPTYITLHIYGYKNVWELSSAVDPNNSAIHFESSKPDEHARPTKGEQ